MTPAARKRDLDNAKLVAMAFGIPALLSALIVLGIRWIGWLS